ncbi:MAG TPA: VCBS repeat-containing protein, partial [Planctomycetia bacterium]|nr:VCBS repeat-containing protein [Planctomycetia bacterium]
MLGNVLSFAVATAFAWSPDFGPPVAVNAGDAWRYGLIAADFNGDGHVDIFSGGGSNLAVSLGNGNGTFGDPILTHVDFPFQGFDDNTYTDNFKVADLNGDGKLDVAFKLVIYSEAGPYGPSGYVRVIVTYAGDGAGGFQPGTSLAYGELDFQFEVGDFSGDGRPDLFVTWQEWGNGLAGFDTLLAQAGGGFA